MDLPRVVLCGRRNVGKSTLLNSLAGRRRAITDSIPGLTRDLLEVEVHRPPFRFLLTDTPGLDLDSPDQLETKALERARREMERADLILCLLEAGPVHPFDRVLLDLLRRQKKPVVYAVNKIDGKEQEWEALTEFYEEGVQDPVSLSAKGSRNLSGLLDRIATLLPGVVRADQETLTEKPRSTAISDSEGTDLKIAIVGRPNAGKSSMLNRFAGRDVSLVSDIPGTTRDTVDTVFRFQNQSIRVMDTAGLRKNSYLRDPRRRVDFFSVRRTQRALRDCDVAIHVFDAVAGLTDFDKKIAALILEYKKPAVLAVNKWDAIPDKDNQTMAEFIDRLHFIFPQSAAYPTVFCSAETGQRLPKLLETCVDLKARLEKRVPTARLNRLVENWNQRLRSLGSGGKIMYAVQADGAPPTFIFFVNEKQGFRESHLSFCENQLREEYEFEGVPITILLRTRERSEK